MTDVTRNVPWRVVKRATGDLRPRVWFDVVDSAGRRICGFAEDEEHIARMCAAGSVAGELYAACLGAKEWLRGPRERDTVDDADVVARLRDAISLAAPLLEPNVLPGRTGEAGEGR